ncbi:MAG TPA: hypothetical protein VNO52_17415 [Methylomirabilota bacterium]|nr:hypothetical protein [Methylomirabilota bacterium]
MKPDQVPADGSAEKTFVKSPVGCPAEGRGWNRRRTLLVAAAAFVFQILVLLVVGERPPPPRPAEASGPRMHLDPESRSPQWTDADDPTLLALPSTAGFSGRAWLAVAPLDYRPSNWVDSPRWLEVDTQALTRVFQTFVRTNTRPPLLVADLPGPRPGAYELNLPADNVATSSTVRVEGEISARPLLSVWKLPSWPSDELLSNTVVQVVVDPVGRVFTAALLPERGESGWPEADALGLRLATTARFAALPEAVRSTPRREPLQLGRLVFQWHTVARPPATNAAPGPL